MQWRGNKYKKIAGTLPRLITRHSEGGGAILRYPNGSAVSLDQAVLQSAPGPDRQRPTPQVSLLSLWHPDQYFYLRDIILNITSLPTSFTIWKGVDCRQIEGESHRGRSLQPRPWNWHPGLFYLYLTDR